jgi:hypothetical protein
MSNLPTIDHFPPLPMQAKRVYDAHHVPEHLQSFMYIYLSTQPTSLSSSTKDGRRISQAGSLSRSSSIQNPSSSSMMGSSHQGAEWGCGCGCGKERQYISPKFPFSIIAFSLNEILVQPLVPRESLNLILEVLLLQIPYLLQILFCRTAGISPRSTNASIFLTAECHDHQ